MVEPCGTKWRPHRPFTEIPPQIITDGLERTVGEVHLGLNLSWRGLRAVCQLERNCETFVSPVNMTEDHFWTVQY